MGLGLKLLFTFSLCSFVFLLIEGNKVGKSSFNPLPRLGSNFKPKKLFVFGDSYADTGNHNITTNSTWNSWLAPYGITYPRKPSGRFSDGRVFTDFLAEFLGLKTPITYRDRNYGAQYLNNGMNFAFGGTGVFNTRAPVPNITTQIDFLEQFLKDSVFTSADLQNSIAHVSLEGNDYSAYHARGGSVEGLRTFVPQVVNQLVMDLQRIYNLGVKKISVTALVPLGCLPRSTQVNSFQTCIDAYNNAAIYHNVLLTQAVSKLNVNQTTRGHGSPFVVIDFYDSFMSIIKEKGTPQGSIKFADQILKPCCIGINQNYTCGSVDEKGNKMYTLCQNPKSSFFWDGVHPTQAGWQAITSVLQANLKLLLSC